MEGVQGDMMKGRAIRFYEKIKYLFIKCVCNNRAECTIPIEALETIARCVFSDIVKYYEEKRNEEKSKSDIPAHLTKDRV